MLSKESTRLTGAKPTGFELQLQALENLIQSYVKVHPAVMVSFSSPENIKNLRLMLKEIDKSFEDYEKEELTLYGKVEERLLKTGLWGDERHTPTCIPLEEP